MKVRFDFVSGRRTDASHNVGQGSDSRGIFHRSEHIGHACQPGCPAGRPGTSQPSTQPGSQAAKQPASQPASQAAKQPASQPASQAAELRGFDLWSLMCHAIIDVFAGDCVIS